MTLFIFKKALFHERARGKNYHFEKGYVENQLTFLKEHFTTKLACVKCSGTIDGFRNRHGFLTNINTFYRHPSLKIPPDQKTLLGWAPSPPPYQLKCHTL